MGEKTLAHRIGKPNRRARFVAAHRDRYQIFGVGRRRSRLRHARLPLSTVFGWQFAPARACSNRERGRATRIGRSMMNFPMQANGAEMMRLAACLATERGIEVCAPVTTPF